MPKNRKELRTCHDCELEDFEACENKKIHRSSLERDELPCRACIRNPEVCGWYDFYSEQWTRDFATVQKGEAGYGRTLIEDPDPHEVGILRIYHVLATGGEKVGIRAKA